MAFVIPQGFSAAGVHAGIKRNPTRQDVALVVSNRPATAAGVYTKNLVYAAPVAFDKRLTPCDGFRAIVINSGNANACTGERGLNDAAEMARLAAAACGAEPLQALVLSTGIIGEFMPMEKIAAGIQACKKELASDEAGFIAAARGMMTTDTVHKLCSLATTIGQRSIHIAGMCKGAAMIAPNMGTMLGLVLTDAPIAATNLQRMLSEVVDDTFNCISVDGHMSTNDTVLLLANGAVGGEKLAGDELKKFQSSLHEMCGELAKSIPADGEGATHLICIDVQGCATVAAARQIAKSVADSPLVKTAIHGADPNWGRIVSAAGYAGVPFNPAGVNLEVNGFHLYKNGAPAEFNGDQVSTSIKSHRETSIVLSFQEGAANARFWTADLTAEYVRLNADYHT